MTDVYKLKQIDWPMYCENTEKWISCWCQKFVVSD